MNDQKGQWMILSGLVLALGLVGLIVLLNQAMSAGYKVSAVETDFANREISEVYEETVRTAKLYKKSDSDLVNFNEDMTDYGNNISKIYASRGVLAELNVTKYSSTIANISMHYYDGKVNFSLDERMIQVVP